MVGGMCGDEGAWREREVRAVGIRRGIKKINND